jgi:hypothetical protein
MRSALFAILCLILVIGSRNDAFASAVTIGGVNYTFTEIDAPGTETEVGGINNFGQVVGDYYDGSTGHYLGFLWNAGSITGTFDSPGSQGVGAIAISNQGNIWLTNNVTSYELIGGPTGTYSAPFSLFGANETRVIAVSSNGMNLGGDYFPTTNPNIDTGSPILGFADIAGSPSSISIPSGCGVSPCVNVWGINDAGTAVGYYFLGNSVYPYSWNAGAVNPLSVNVPGYPDSQAQALGINDRNQIVGYLPDEHVGFLDSGGNYYPVTIPVPYTFVSAVGINDAGQITGNFEDPSGGLHSYILTPPTPPSIQVGFQGGPPSNARPLPPNSKVAEILAQIGGAYGLTDFYKFSWTGGTFIATGLVNLTGANVLDAFFDFDLLSVNGTILDYILLNETDNFTGTISLNLVAGDYGIGFVGHDLIPDPSVEIDFLSPVEGIPATAVPEPLVWVTYITVLGLLKFLPRMRNQFAWS